MFRNYLKIAWRNLKSSKSFSAINISGLAIGMASAMLIFLWLQNMLTFDRFHEKTDRLYVIYNKDKRESLGDWVAWPWTPKILAPTLKQNYPEVDGYTRYTAGESFLLTADHKKINAGRGSLVDPGFLKMFSFSLLKGDIDKALEGSDKIVLTEKLAKVLFGKESALGKSIKVDSVNYVTVGGVLKDLPSNTMFDFDYLLSWEYARKLNWVDSSWDNNSVESFILLKPNSNLATFNRKIEEEYIRHSKDSEFRQVFAQPLSKYYLYNEQENGQLVKGRIEIVRLFTVIALFILLIACINFMNLSTARSEKKAREVGIRKVVGAGRGSLIAQFITESMLLSFIAFILALGMVIISLPFFGKLACVELHVPFESPAAWAFGMGFVLFTGLLAGSYPALMLSAFQPVKVLKGSFVKIHSRFNIRSLLVVVQFTFAIVLIISTIVVSRQIDYAQKRDNGYNRDQLLYTSIKGDLEKNYRPLRNELLQSGAVTSLSKNFSPITERYSNNWGYSWQGSTERDKKMDFIKYATDADLVKTMGLKLLQGRDIDIYKYPADSNAVLLTETALRKMRVKDPIGLTITEHDNTKWNVVGVVKDILIESPNAEILPMLIFGPWHWSSTIHYRLNADRSVAENIAVIKKVFEKYNSDYPFEYRFVDAEYAKKFAETQRIAQLSMLFTGLTILISCLGLLGLVTFMAERRTKEIGVRKVLGASVLSISSLLTKDFLKLIGISFIIASPMAWYAMHKWLQNFDYRIPISWLWFVLAAVCAIVLALVTVGFQAVKAARANPVKSLKTE